MIVVDINEIFLKKLLCLDRLLMEEKLFQVGSETPMGIAGQVRPNRRK